MVGKMVVEVLMGGIKDVIIKMNFLMMMKWLMYSFKYIWLICWIVLLLDDEVVLV